jgi:hypothetical protein
LLPPGHEGRAASVEEKVDVLIWNLRGVHAELSCDRGTAGVPALRRRRVAKCLRSFFGCLPFALSTLAGQDGVGGGNPLPRFLDLSLE